MVLSPQPATTQLLDEADHISPQLWVDYNPSWRLGDKVDLYGDLGVRSELESGGWWRFILRPSVRYQAGEHVRLSGGLGGFYTVNQVIANRLEVRPWQGVSASWPRGRVPFEHFLRLEERFDFNLRNGSSLNSVRARYRLRPSYDWHRAGPGRYWRLMASGEVFYHIVGEPAQFDEEVRLTVSLERGVRVRLRVRLDATWQKEGRAFREGTIDDLLLRVRVFTAW
jgi:hypothetical protein